MSEANENTVAMSAEIGELANALAKAQVKIKGAVKYSENPYFHSRYADLATVWDACREPLSEQGLAVIQTTDGTPDQVVILTTLAHNSGQWIRGRLAMKPVKADPQGIGSCLTYGRRYALSAIVGVAPEDDDGTAASAPGPQCEKQAKKKEPAQKFTPRKSSDTMKQAAAEGKLNPVNLEAAKEIAEKTGVETVPEKLETLMELSGIKLDEMKSYLKNKGFIPEDGEINDLHKDPDTFDQMIEDVNWNKVVSNIKATRTKA